METRELSDGQNVMARLINRLDPPHLIAACYKQLADTYQFKFTIASMVV